VSFSNSATAYTLQGAGKISGSTALIKALAARTVIATTNDYNGGTTISGGTLQLGDGATANGSLGSGTGKQGVQI
jgi:autotransporter-associated beta strand protein